MPAEVEAGAATGRSVGTHRDRPQHGQRTELPPWSSGTSSVQRHSVHAKRIIGRLAPEKVRASAECIAAWARAQEAAVSDAGPIGGPAGLFHQRVVVGKIRRRAMK